MNSPYNGAATEAVSVKLWPSNKKLEIPPPLEDKALLFGRWLLAKAMIIISIVIISIIIIILTQNHFLRLKTAQ